MSSQTSEDSRVSIWVSVQPSALFAPREIKRKIYIKNLSKVLVPPRASRASLEPHWRDERRSSLRYALIWCFADGGGERGDMVTAKATAYGVMWFSYVQWPLYGSICTHCLPPLIYSGFLLIFVAHLYVIRSDFKLSSAFGKRSGI